MKKKGLLCICIFLILTLLVNLTGCFDLENDPMVKKLNKIEQYGDYSFQQNVYYVHKGKHYNILDELRKSNRKYGLRKGLGSIQYPRFVYYNGYNYIYYPYRAYKVKGEEYYDCVIVKTPMNKPKDIQVITTIKKSKYVSTYRKFVSNSISGLLFLYTNEKIITIDLKNEKILNLFENGVKDSNLKIQNEFTTLFYRVEREGKNEPVITILDKELNKYQPSNLPNEININNTKIFNDYLIINNNQVFNFKENVKIDDENSKVIIENCHNFEQTNPEYFGIEEDEKNLFTYNGQKFSWENKTRRIEQESTTSSNETVYVHYYYNDLVITNTETQETYTLIHEEFDQQFHNIKKASYEEITCHDIYTMNDELYFCYYYYSFAWFAPSLATTPSIVFKYDEKSNKLLYIGLGYIQASSPIIHKGNVLE